MDYMKSAQETAGDENKWVKVGDCFVDMSKATCLLPNGDGGYILYLIGDSDGVLVSADESEDVLLYIASHRWPRAWARKAESSLPEDAWVARYNALVARLHDSAE